MRIRWRGLELPSRVVRDETVSTDSYARFTIEPFEQGFGTTIGNSLRRVLLSSLEGAAVTTVKIDGVSHEFTNIEGVLEDVTEILLNIKGIVLRVTGDESKRLIIERNTAGEVRAGDISTDPAVTIADSDHLIATLTADVHFRVEMTVVKGRGYVMGSDNRLPGQELGVIPVDSVFSPVLRVRYRTEDMRVGQRTNYDRLILEIWTNRTVTPDEALVEAGLILRKHLNPFVMYHELGEAVAETTTRLVETEITGGSALEELLDRSVSILGLSVRARNCLQAARIAVLRELVTRTEGDLLRFRSFGKTSLQEVQRKLEEIGLALGMKAEPGSTSGEVAGPEGTVPDGNDAGVSELPQDPSVPAETGPMEAFTVGE